MGVYVFVCMFVSLMALLAVKLLRERQLRLLGLDPQQMAAFLAAAAAL